MVQMEMKICHLENQLESSRCENSKACDFKEAEEIHNKYLTLKNQVKFTFFKDN